MSQARPAVTGLLRIARPEGGPGGCPVQRESRAFPPVSERRPMAGGSQRDGSRRCGTAGPGPARRAVLLAVGLGGALAGCSTAAVPYTAGENGQLPGAAPAASGTASGAMPAGGGPGGAGQAGDATARGTVLAAARDIPVGGGMVFPAQKVVVTQPVAGRFLAFSAVCTHVGCLVNKVVNGTIDCPCHGSEFSIGNGAVVTGPATAALPPRRIKVTGGKVILL